MIWQTQITTEVDDRVIKLSFFKAHASLSYSDAIDLLQLNDSFREFFIDQLRESPFAIYRWETPPVCKANRLRQFECVLVNSPSLSCNPNWQPFAGIIKPELAGEIISFTNLGKDALLIVPCPVELDSDFSHLAAFHQNASRKQVNALWQRVGIEMANCLSEKPIWLNTAGAGVAWLHVRLDSIPKYYHYFPYRNELI